MTPLFELGYGYFGGLTYAGETGLLHAIGGDSGDVQRTLFRIDVALRTSTWVDDLAGGEFSCHGGLAFGDRLQLLGHNGEASNLFTYSPLERGQDLDGVYRSVRFPAAGGPGPGSARERLVGSDLPSRDFSADACELRRRGGSKFGFELGLTGLTLAEETGKVPEPVSALLLAAACFALATASGQIPNSSPAKVPNTPLPVSGTLAVTGRVPVDNTVPVAVPAGAPLPVKIGEVPTVSPATGTMPVSGTVALSGPPTVTLSGADSQVRLAGTPFSLEGEAVLPDGVLFRAATQLVPFRPAATARSSLFRCAAPSSSPAGSG